MDCLEAGGDLDDVAPNGFFGNGCGVVVVEVVA